MGSGYKKIIIGIFLATFHINLGLFQFVPPFLGWLVVAIGVTELLEKFPNTSFRRASLLSKIILAYTLFTDSVAFFNPALLSPGSMLRFAPVVYAIFHLLFAYHILEGSTLYVRSLQMEDLEKSLVARTGTFIVFYLMNSTVICYALAFHGAVLLILSAIAGVILNIWFMMMMNELKKLEAIPGPTESIPNSTNAMEPDQNRES
ncbi:MAG TPA: hypothetical protein VLN47_01620 [Clostridiaceae bacterium]|nr:hypothetical protein [Clostridiaceae bacterium]